MMWVRLIWNTGPWWFWLGITLLILSVIWGLAWFWLDLTWPKFSGHGFWLVLTLAFIGGTLTAVGLQREPLPLGILVHLPPEASPAPTANRIGLLRWLRQKYRRHKELF
ncbi:hypothetical protein LCGC14_1496210 [marine sediment metagenome]|uniref:Uncharacterized protein n=1 Tax=marine sediment metagenome TaxID=412755 RepID=A0A0F9M6Y7_9ZZZZ